ncbi:MAG TPA: hypothetical protein VGL91_18370 [Acidobacteriota bacterium]
MDASGRLLHCLVPPGIIKYDIARLQLYFLRRWNNRVAAQEQSRWLGDRGERESGGVGEWESGRVGE